VLKPCSLVLPVAVTIFGFHFGTAQKALGLDESRAETQAATNAGDNHQNPHLTFSVTPNVGERNEVERDAVSQQSLAHTYLFSNDSSARSRFSTQKRPNLTWGKAIRFDAATAFELDGQGLNLSSESRSGISVAVPPILQATTLPPVKQSSAKTLIVKDESSQSAESKPKPDKSKYSLFNPTPQAFLRDFDTDRPDKTGSPYTVDAGHIILESDLFVYTRDVDKTGTDVSTFNYLIPNLRIGLTNNIDLQIIPEIYKVQRNKSKDGTAETLSGFGDTTVRLKVNFWGNDGGKTAFAAVPFVKFPTNQDGLGNNAIEGGIVFPLFVELSDHWDVGMQTEFDVNHNQDSSGYNAGFINTVSFGYKINNKLSSYFELFTNQTTEKGASFIGTFDTGLKYLLTDNVQLDAGINVGITDAADDYQPFVGLSFRF
jgi:Putative MetA-pathway of phenol degradation